MHLDVILEIVDCRHKLVGITKNTEVQLKTFLCSTSLFFHKVVPCAACPEFLFLFSKVLKTTKNINNISQFKNGNHFESPVTMTFSAFVYAFCEPPTFYSFCPPF